MLADNTAAGYLRFFLIHDQLFCYFHRWITRIISNICFWLCCWFQFHWRLWRFWHSFINNFFSSLRIWICYCDISASSSMDICSFQQFVSAKCTSFIILCLFFCSAFITLLEVIRLTCVLYKKNQQFQFKLLQESYFWCYVIPVIDQWRASIGRFHNRLVIPKTTKNLSDPVIIFKCIFTSFYNVFLSILILKTGDIELYPGSPKNSHLYFSCCHWNVNSIVTDNYSKVVALKAYNSIYKYDFICVSETFLDSSFDLDDKMLMLEGYNLIRSDHPSNTKRGGVCIYYKESLAVLLVDITSLPECLVFEVTM